MIDNPVYPVVVSPNCHAVVRYQPFNTAGFGFVSAQLTYVSIAPQDDVAALFVEIDGVVQRAGIHYLATRIAADDQLMKAILQRAGFYYAETSIRLSLDGRRIGLATALLFVRAWHFFVIHVPPAVRDLAISWLNDCGIGAAVNFRAMPTLHFYKEKYAYGGGEFPQAEHWRGGVISLLFFPGMTDADQDEVIAAVKTEILPLLAGSVA